MTDHDDLIGRSSPGAPDRGLAALLDHTLAGEPPLLDLVPGAVAGARRRQSRERLTLAVAPVLVATVGLAGYAMVPRAGGPAVPGGIQAATPSFPAAAPAPQCEGVKTMHMTNVVPHTDAQASYLCDLTFDTLAALFPDARLSFPLNRPRTWGEANEIEVTTDRGSAAFQIEYVWPAYDKGKAPGFMDTTCPSGGKSGSCAETAPAPRLRGELTGGDSTTPGYMVDDAQGGWYIISIGQTPGYYTAMPSLASLPGPYEPPYTAVEFKSALLNPRFSAYLRQYADYVLAYSPMKWPEGATYKKHLE